MAKYQVQRSTPTHTAYVELRFGKWHANWNNRKPRYVMASKEPRWPQSKNKLISRYGIDAQGNTHVEINGISATLENELFKQNVVSSVVTPIQERPWLGCTSWSSKIWHSPLFSPHFCLQALATLCIRWTLYAHTHSFSFSFVFSFLLLYSPHDHLMLLHSRTLFLCGIEYTKLRNHKMNHSRR